MSDCMQKCDSTSSMRPKIPPNPTSMLFLAEHHAQSSAKGNYPRAILSRRWRFHATLQDDHSQPEETAMTSILYKERFAANKDSSSQSRVPAVREIPHPGRRSPTDRLQPFSRLSTATGPQLTRKPTSSQISFTQVTNVAVRRRNSMTHYANRNHVLLFPCLTAFSSRISTSF